MAMMTLTEAFAEIEAINRHCALKRAFLLALTVRPATLRDPLTSVGGSASVASEEQKSLAALEEHRLAVRRAVRVVAQNATITIGHQTRTIADWLEWRRAVAPGHRHFLSSLRERIRSARQQAEGWNYALPESSASARSIDIVVNLHEPDMARQSEYLEEALGTLDGQLSLKSAILTIEIASLSESLLAREAQLTAWLQHLGKDTLPITVARRARGSGYESAKDYEIPEEYDAYTGYGMSAVPSAIRDQVRGLLSGGRKIEAIKLVRERTGWALLQAKEAVEAFQ